MYFPSTYGLQYIDKAALSVGALFGLLQDLQLVRVLSLNPTVTDTGVRFPPFRRPALRCWPNPCHSSEVFERRHDLL